MKYNKLIRDKIPTIIQEAGNQCVIRKMNKDEYYDALNRKLREELKEYEASHKIEELADMLEVIYAIAKHRGLSKEDMSAVMEKKRLKNGGFDEQWMLLKVTKHRHEPGSITFTMCE